MAAEADIVVGIADQPAGIVRQPELPRHQKRGAWDKLQEAARASMAADPRIEHALLAA